MLAIYYLLQIMNYITARRCVQYQSNTPTPKNGFKCIILDGTRYIIHIFKDKVTKLYDTKKNATKQTKHTLVDKQSSQIIAKINEFLNDAKVKLEEDYAFEVIFSMKGVVFTDVLYCANIELEEKSYNERIAILNDLIPVKLQRLRVIDNQPTYNIDSTQITTDIILRPLSSFPSYSVDYTLSPIETHYTYAVCGVGYITKPDIIMKRGNYTNMNMINATIKKALTEDDETMIEAVAKYTVENQLLFYNRLKTQYFSEIVNNETQDTVAFKSHQVQNVQLIAAVDETTSNMMIFAYAKHDPKVFDASNIVHVEKPDTVNWLDDKFKATFMNVDYYKNLYTITCKYNSKYAKSKLSNLTILSVTSKYNSQSPNFEAIDKLPSQEKQKSTSISLNNATNDEILKECINRLLNIATENNNSEIKKLLGMLQNIQLFEPNIKYKFEELLTLLQENEYHQIKHIIGPLTDQFVEYNINTIHNIKYRLSQLKRKRKDASSDDIINLKKSKGMVSEDYFSSD